MKNIALLLLLQVVISACSLGLLDVKSDNKRSDYDSDSAFDRAFKNSDVECGSTNCPDSIVGMYIIDDQAGGRSLGSCSGTYIGENRVLTNAHCIPDELQYAGAGCVGKIKINFPANGRFQKEKYDCSRILRLSRDSSKISEPDWAVIQFSGNTSRKAAAMNFGGVVPESKVTAYKVNFNLSTSVVTTGNIYKTTCVANSNHFKSTDNLGAVSPLFNVSSCDHRVIQGNSGSGFFNSRGELVGVFSFGLLVRESSERWAKKMRARHPNIEQNFGGGTNLACVDYLNPSPLSPRCYYGNFVTYKARTSVYAFNYIKQKSIAGDNSIMEEVRDAIESENDLRFEWASGKDFPNLQFSSSGGGAGQLQYLYKYLLKQTYLIVPKCVKSTSNQIEFQIPTVTSDSSQVHPVSFAETKKLKVDLKTFVAERIVGSTSYWVSPRFGRFTSYYNESLIRVSEGARFMLPNCQ